MTRQQMVVVCVCGVALCMMMLASTHTEERETSLSRTVSTISLYDVPAGSPRNQTD